MRNFSVGLCLSDGRENLVVESLGSSAGAGVENLTPPSNYDLPILPSSAAGAGAVSESS